MDNDKMTVRDVLWLVSIVTFAIWLFFGRFIII